MINIPNLTEELIENLGRELGGCDFTDPHQIEFLSCRTSCDVQAVPGNGKTTLLAAKLALLSRSWASRDQGVCVISHTNAAREEVEGKLALHPRAHMFLTYPHFVGTVTAFVDRFIALPYLRGLGWPLRRIDDDVFMAAALSAAARKPKLQASRRAAGRAHQVNGWISRLELASTFPADTQGIPARLAVRDRGNRQPGPHTDSGRELEELKADLVRRGLYRFGDMTVLANRALDACPYLLDAVRHRFPLVILDEAQDTCGTQLRLLDRLFAEGVAYQRMGDQNQTLYEDAEVPVDQYWRPAAGAIPLNATRRFGTHIAQFASRLTVRVGQEIAGKTEYPCRRTLLLFDEPTIRQVLPAFGEEVTAFYGNEFSGALDIRAVASRHNLYRDRRGDWPKSLPDYHPPYRSGAGTGDRSDTLCNAMRRTSRLHAQGNRHPEVLSLINACVVDFLEAHGFQPGTGVRLAPANLWRSLASRGDCRPMDVRRLVVEHVLYGGAAWETAQWAQFCDSLRDALGVNAGAAAAAAVQFCAFEQEGALEAMDADEPDQNTYLHEGVPVRLGSVHSVKGRTVDALLLMETEVFRDHRRVMDLATVLPHGFGVENRNFAADEAQLSAATNVFVAVTRPRQVLTLAMRKAAAQQRMLDAAEQQGWVVRDLTCHQ